MPYWNNTCEHTSTINKPSGMGTYHWQNLHRTTDIRRPSKTHTFLANYGTHPGYEMIGHLIQGRQTKPLEMTLLHESLRNKMVAVQLRQKQ